MLLVRINRLWRNALGFGFNRAPTCGGSWGNIDSGPLGVWHRRHDPAPHSGCFTIIIFLQLRSELLVVTTLSDVVFALNCHALDTQWHMLYLRLQLNPVHVNVLELAAVLALVVFQHLCFQIQIFRGFDLHELHFFKFAILLERVHYLCGIFLKILISILLQLVVDVLQLVLDLSLGLFGSRDH